MISSHDIFGVSETWLQDGDISSDAVDGFTFHPFHREIKEKSASSKGGSLRGGVGVFIKNELQDHIKIRKDISCENFIWCKLKKSHFGYRDDVYLGFIYFTPETSKREKKLDLDHFKRLQEVMHKLNSDQIILMGDFNARTSNMEDILTGEREEEEIFHSNFFSKITSKRSNQDHENNPIIHCKWSNSW